MLIFNFTIMYKIKIFAALFIFGVLLSGCNIFNEPDPYEYAKENHRFFRCKVNGLEWHNEGFGFYGDYSAIEYYDSPYDTLRDGNFTVHMWYYPNKNICETISFAVLQLNEGENKAINFRFGIWKPESKIYKTDESYNNYLIIEKIDSVNEIIKGNFEFRAITEDGKDTVLVNDGEFEWKVYWYK